MSQINSGGAAFPMPGADYTEDRGDFKCEVSHGPQLGMTLRDYFAAKALPAFISNQLGGNWPGDETIAKYAYELADAMLKARTHG